MRKITIILVFALAGCATQKPASWRRVDGAPINPQQAAVDQTFCRGEMQKSNLSATMEDDLRLGVRGFFNPRDDALRNVYDGCMAQRGYIRE